MIVACIKNFVVNKPEIILGIALLRNVSTTFLPRARCNSLLKVNNIYNFKIVSFISSVQNLNKTLLNSKVSNNSSDNSNKCYNQTTSSNNSNNKSPLNVQLKKRPLRKKKNVSDDEKDAQPGFFNIKAMATADEYDLENLLKGLIHQNLYEPKPMSTSGKSVPDVVYAVAKYEVGPEPRELYFFREGTIVMWNTSELESRNLLQFLKSYEENSYSPSLVRAESDMISYVYTEYGVRSHLKDGDIYLPPNVSNLDKYTFSNALSQSVKLGIWEASLDQYIDSIEFITDDLKAGKKIKMTREEVLRKQGELFALRHVINLSSDLLDIPDFYWEQDELEQLYQKTCSYFSITKRTKVMNEKINHCVELVELLSSHLSDRHHIRLEWMIIILIIAEVVFEMIHFADRYLSNFTEHSHLKHSSIPT